MFTVSFFPAGKSEWQFGEKNPYCLQTCPGVQDIVTNFQTSHVIQSEYRDCYPGTRRTRLDERAPKVEVIAPVVPAGMEKKFDFTSDGIDSGQVWTFIKITAMTRESKIAKNAVATVLSGNNMLDVMS